MLVHFGEGETKVLNKTKKTKGLFLRIVKCDLLRVQEAKHDKKDKRTVSVLTC
jgi:hypothetical protein